jgi:hypothetical protein
MAAAPGWYPDPDGTPGRYRYWDGRQWSRQTTTDPASRPPGPHPGRRTTPTGIQAEQFRNGQHRNRRRTPLFLGLLVLLVVVVLVVVLAVRSLLGQDSAVSDPNPPRSSVSGWDDSSPLPTSGPTTSTSPDSADPQGGVPCADGAPEQHAEHPSDSRLYGGRLSIEQPGSPWTRDDDYAAGLSFAYDVSGAREQVESQWWAMVAVGELRTADGFHTPKQSADGVMQCLASSFYYAYFTGRTDVFSKKFALDGHTGWALRSQIHVDDPLVRATGDVVEVIVLQTGGAGRLSLFAGFVPIGDQQRIRLLDT